MSEFGLFEFSDREVMLAIEDHARSDGWTNTRDLTDNLGITGEHARSSVASRLNWMVRFGVVEHRKVLAPNRDVGHRGNSIWKLTDAGRQIAHGTLGDEARDVLKRLTRSQVVAFMGVAAQVAGAVPDSHRHLMKREWRRGLGR